MDHINTDAAKAANLPFSLAVRAGDTVHISGNLGNVVGKWELVPGGIEAESKQTMENIGAALKLAGLTYDDIVKVTVYLADLKEWAAFNKAYTGYFKPGKFPARTAVEVQALIMGARVEVECVAYAGGK